MSSDEIRIEDNISILGKVNVNFLELSSIIFRELYCKEDEVQRQKNIPHLGLIAEAFHGIKHSRYEYLLMQCVISEQFENTFKGTTSAQGSININKFKYFGNDIIKCWFLLSNFGHCKNTLGDEKALLIRAVQRKGFRRYLLNSIKDKELKEWADEVIQSFDYMNFHHVLSVIRIYKCLPKKIKLQNKIIFIYKLLLLDPRYINDQVNISKIEHLREIMMNIRYLSIISVDIRNSSVPFNVDLFSNILLMDMYESRYMNTDIREIYEPIMSLLYDYLYLHEKSQTYQRAYEADAVSNLAKSRYKDIISNSFSNGLSNLKPKKLSHFMRAKLHKDFINDDIKDAMRISSTVQRQLGESVKASIDYNPYTNYRVFDFYINNEEFNNNNMPKFLSNITKILINQANGAVNTYIEDRSNIIKKIESKSEKIGVKHEKVKSLIDFIEDEIKKESAEYIIHENISVFKDILWSILRYHISDKFYFDIELHTSPYYNYYGLIIAGQIDLLSNEINAAIKENTEDKNEDRVHELSHLKKSIKKNYTGTTIACLSRIIIYDYSKPPDSRLVTDIDSVVLRYDENDMWLEVNETKNVDNPCKKARNDIMGKLTKILNQNCVGRRVRDVKGYGAKVVIKHSRN